MKSLFLPKTVSAERLYSIYRDDDHPMAVEARNRLEEMWKDYAEYAEPDFQLELCRQFAQRFWEMYLAVSLLKQGHQLAQKKVRGPDIKIRENSRSIWIEAVAPTMGDPKKADSIPPLAVDGSTHEVHGRQMRLRLAQAFTEKSKIFRDRYIPQNIVSQDDALVIAISSNDWDMQRHLSGLHPDIVRVLFGLGDTVVTFNKSNKKVTVGVETETALQKSTAPIGIDFFRKDEFSFVSAVIYSTADAANLPETLGFDFLFIRNPFAINPLPPNWPRIGTEYIVEE